MKRGTLLASASWLAVVILGAGLVWFVISDAGRVVSASGEVPVATSPADGTTSPGSASASPTKAARKPATKRPGARATSSPASTAPTPAPAASGSSPRPARQQPRPRRSTSSPAPAPTTVVRTWSGTGGSVTVSCTGRTVRLKGAAPDDGWRVERGSDGPAEVEVTFLKDDTQVQVQSECSGGRPVFDVERETDQP